MLTDYSEQIQAILICPHCATPLHLATEEVICQQCQISFPKIEKGPLDLRLQKPKKHVLSFELGQLMPVAPHLKFTPLDINPYPQVNFADEVIPHHLSAEILSYFPQAKNNNSLMLDLGCGSAIHRSVCERAGFQYVGLDYDVPQAPFWGDAHALPFADNSFEFILSIAVLEHIRYPFVMMQEAFRVLKPGGRFIGTVAFLEPFHLNSYYHHSHLGTLNTLQFAGFQVTSVAPNSKWTGLRAQAFMSLFWRMPRWYTSIIVAPTQAMQKLWWRLRYLKNRELEMNDVIRDATGSFAFIATK